MGSNAISAQGQAALIKGGIATQADFSDEEAEAPVGAASSKLGIQPGQGKTFTPATMTPAQAAAMQAQQNAAADANRAKMMQRNAASRRALPQSMPFNDQ
jgi:hypothetical protein